MFLLVSKKIKRAPCGGRVKEGFATELEKRCHIMRRRGSATTGRRKRPGLTPSIPTNEWTCLCETEKP
jgi:hypothetical protein